MDEEQEQEHQHVGCLIVDAHEGLRRGVAERLGREPGLVVVGETGEGDRVVALAERRRASIVIADLLPPGAPASELCRRLAERLPETGVVVYCERADAHQVEELLEAGARGVVLKASPIDELVRAVRIAAQSRTFLDAGLAASVLGAGARTRRLSPREREVLQLLSTGLSTPDVGRTLSLSPGTVQDYVESAVRKLEARNRVHAVATALLDQLIEGPAESDARSRLTAAAR